MDAGHNILGSTVLKDPSHSSTSLQDHCYGESGHQSQAKARMATDQDLRRGVCQLPRLKSGTVVSFKTDTAILIPPNSGEYWTNTADK